MRRDAELRVVVHLVRADLNLEGLAARSHHRGVQGLIDAKARRGDVVFEAARQRRVQGVDHADTRVTGVHVVHEDADAHEVEDLSELVSADDHLLVYRPVVLRAAHDLGVDAIVAQCARDFVDDFFQRLVARGRAVSDHAHDLVVLLGVQNREGEVLQLPLHARHAQAVRERCDDVERLAGLLRLLLRRQEPHGPHVVEAVADLDDEDARVRGHGDDHLADGLGLRRRAEGHLVELRHSVDQAHDLRTKVAS